jgi:glycine betaine/proline transport system substrate-binding protein
MLSRRTPWRIVASSVRVEFSDVGWTDITATTAATTVVLNALGYETDIKVLSVPVTYTSLAAGDIDVFLGNWMPTMEADIAPYREAGTVDTVRANLEGAKYTLAVNNASRRSGHRRFRRYRRPDAEALDGKIYGIEPGNDGNRLIIDMIAADAFGLTGSKWSKARNRGCWRRSRGPTAATSRWCSWAGSRIR